MDKFEIKKEITKLIDTIKQQSANPQLEHELMNTIKKLYETSIVYAHLNSITNNQPVNNTPKQEISKSESVKRTIVDLFGETPVAPDKPKPEKKTEQPGAAVKIQTPTITDLKSAIGINDQFQFANELFEGSLQEYNIAIQQLNTSESLESAMFYFESLQQLYNWDNNNQTVKKLLELVDRRYSA